MEHVSPVAGAVPASPRQVTRPDVDDDPLIGATIGSFQVTRRLGLGGMGTVYLGEQAAIGSKVAIKVLHEHLATNPSLVQRFYAEARATNLIGHEHIVSIIDLSVLPPNRYYFIMEYLEGRALNELLRPMPPAQVVHIITQACDALQAAHTHGVVHRDLKPENMILIRRGRNEQFLKILDFGIAKLFATELAGQKTMAGMIMGTPEFMAPEQTTGEPVDGRTDLYALGIIAYELATGRLPFTGANLADLLVAQRIQAAVPPYVINPVVPLGLSDAIMKAMAKTPDDRWQSADEFREALEASLDELAHSPSAPLLAYGPASTQSSSGAGSLPGPRPSGPVARSGSSGGAVITGSEPRSRAKGTPAASAPPVSAPPSRAPGRGGEEGDRGSTSSNTELSTWVEAFSEAPPAKQHHSPSGEPQLHPPPGDADRKSEGIAPSAAPLPPVEAPPAPAAPKASGGAWAFSGSTASRAGATEMVGAPRAAPSEPAASPNAAPPTPDLPVAQATHAAPAGGGKVDAGAQTPSASSQAEEGRPESSPSRTPSPAKGAAPLGGVEARGTPGGAWAPPPPTGARRTPGATQRGGSSPSVARAVFGNGPGTPVPGRPATPQPELRGAWWSTKVFDRPKGAFRVLRGTDVTRGGMFLLADDGFPAVFSRLKLAVMVPDGELTLNAEVVRHVTAEQSRAWNMPIGFGVQFVDLTQAQRDDVADLALGRPRGSSGLHRPPEKDDAQAEELLAKYRARAAASHYEFLGLFEDADFGEVRQRVRDAKRALVELRGRALSARQRDAVETFDKKLDAILLTIGQPRNRLDYDAQRGNWKGTARCIAGGVSVTDLDNARRRYLIGKERNEGVAHLHFTTGSAWESQKDFLRAQQEFERALTLDPLNLAFHQRYQALRRMMSAPLAPPKRR